MLDSLPEALRVAWRQIGEDAQRFDALRLAVSGGTDSLAMLVGFVRLRDAGLIDTALEVLTVDHGLRAESSAEAATVADICRALDIPCHRARLTPPQDIKNKQAWARTQRYKAFATLGAAGAPVLTAHTADDQAETVLMRAARGTGSEGLAGIRTPITIIVGAGPIYRPFLTWRREDLHAILKGSAWEPVQDPSNEDDAYTRVRFRRWLADAPYPDSDRSIVQGLAETARIAAHENAALHHYADALVAAAGGAERGFVDGHVSLLAQPLAVQARCLRQILAQVARLEDDPIYRFSPSFDLGRMVTLAEQMAGVPQGRWVGGGVVLDWRHEGQEEGQEVRQENGQAKAPSTHLTAFAEAGRKGFPTMKVEAGAWAVWDGRFQIANRSAHAVVVRPWTPSDLVAYQAFRAMPKHVLASLPVAVHQDQVVAWAGVPDHRVGLTQGRAVIGYLHRFLP